MEQKINSVINDSVQVEMKYQVMNNHIRNLPWPVFAKLEDELAYLILEQRYKNLITFIQKQSRKYTGMDAEELQELWFIYNDLKEINYIGTDIYADTVFVKHTVPYLYRSCPGEDYHASNRVVMGQEEPETMGKTIFEECLKQIKSGGNGKLYSYSKSFGKMLYKYATIQGVNQKTIIEIRKNATVNAVSEDGNHAKSMQRYIREVQSRNVKTDIPYFAVDMSNAREDMVEYLKTWLDAYLGEQRYVKRYEDIYDPIGDAEVVSNFTYVCKDGKGLLASEVKRIELNRDELCVLLYEYFKIYVQRKNMEQRFHSFIQNTLSTLRDVENGSFKTFYDSIINNTIVGVDRSKIADILNNHIDWNKEEMYMARCKGERAEHCTETAHIDVYKGNNAEPKSRVWKEILFGAVEYNYTHINYSGQR